MSFDYNKLLGKMREQQITQKMLAEEIHNTTSTLSQKLNNKGYFKQNEICHACAFLRIPVEEIGEYFFTQKV